MNEDRAQQRCQVAVVGAGPYGLAAAAHLRPYGLDMRVLGEPMSYWSEMPRGMWLRSPWHASSISDPADALTLDAYEVAAGRQLERPIRLDDFVAYGRWFQEHVAPDLDTSRVSTIDSDDGGLRIRLDDDRDLHADAVVLATGLLGAARRLPHMTGLPDGMCSHTCDLRDPADFTGRRVLVVGGGQSATESAALLHEAGADVEIVMRAPEVNWLLRSGRLHQSRLRPLFYPDTDVGPPILNQIVNKPWLFARFPTAVQERMAHRSIRPAAAGWLKRRLADVRITYGRWPVAAQVRDGQVVVRLDDGSERTVDHVMQGTGFRLDVRAHPLLAPALAARVRARNGYPLLTQTYESSVPGLHFVGALSAISHGPVMRFVSGTWATGPAVARGVARAVARGPATTGPIAGRRPALIAHASRSAS